MPRAFDSDENPTALRFTENVDCPRCGEIFEGDFVDRTRSLSVQDIREQPQGGHICPACDFSFVSWMTGWMFYGEAG